MHFNEHPTWRMLEDGKNYFKFLAQSSADVEIVLVADSAIQSLHSLQLEVENQLITDSRDSDE
jgi:hypothetical protein